MLAALCGSLCAGDSEHHLALLDSSPAVHHDHGDSHEGAAPASAMNHRHQYTALTEGSDDCAVVGAVDASCCAGGVPAPAATLTAAVTASGAPATPFAAIVATDDIAGRASTRAAGSKSPPFTSPSPARSSILRI